MLLEKLAQMQASIDQVQAENRLLSQQLASVTGSSAASYRSTATPLSKAESPTLTPSLFKEETTEQPFDIQSIPVSLAPANPSFNFKPESMTNELSDLAQHPAAVLCDLQCQSETSQPWTHEQRRAMWLIQTFATQIFFLTTLSTIFSQITSPLCRVFLTTLPALSTPLKESMMFSEQEITLHFPLIQWLILTPTNLLNSNSQTARPLRALRMNLLRRLLASSPIMARSLQSATDRLLKLASSNGDLSQTVGGGSGVDGTRDWQSSGSLMAMSRAIESIEMEDGHTHSVRDPLSEARRTCELLDDMVRRSRHGQMATEGVGRSGSHMVNVLSGKSL